MNLNKFTEKAQEAVISAQSLASEMNHAQIEPEHLLVTLAEQQGGVVPSLLRKLNVDPADVARAAREHLARQPRAHGGSEPSLAPRLRVDLEAAQADAKSMQDEFVSTEHLLLGLLKETGKSPSIDILRVRGVSRRSSAFRKTNRVCGSGPSEASTSRSTPSTIDNVRSTSPPKSAWPGVSTMFTSVSL